MKADFEGICSSFNEIYWHDSRVINLHLLKESEEKKYNLVLDVNLFEKNADGKMKRVGRTITFKECRIIILDFDLLGVLFCNGDISNASCTSNSKKLEAEKRGKLRHFDFPDTFNPLEKCLGFTLEMIHPGGELIVFARNFELQ